MSQSKVRIALDVGEKRIGVAISDGVVAIARPLKTILVDGGELGQIAAIVADEDVQEVIVGYPRNQSGDPTAQTGYVENFSKQLEDAIAVPIVFQDESLTSVLAEEQLKSHGRPYQKSDIDMKAAALILQDYLEVQNEK